MAADPPLLGFSALVLAAACLASCAALNPDSSSGHAKLQSTAVKIKVPKDHIPDWSKVIHLSWKPRAFLFPAFLSPQECDYIIAISRPTLKRTTVGGSDDSHGVVDDVRTSHGTFLDKYDDPVVARIEERVANWTFLPIENQEAMQVLRYQYSEKYGAHHDYMGAGTPAGARYATVLLYLTDVEFGGETVFPKSEDPVKKDSTWSACGKEGLAVKPRKGNALLFFSMAPDGSFEDASMHSGCPVLKGEKWSATKWIHTNAFGPSWRNPDECVDENEGCAGWARSGECDKNVKFMKGTGRLQGQLGFCRKSCKVCS